jgi:hypothetical protein
MTIWEKAIINMQKGSRKIFTSAAVFSERVKSEIAMARLRIRLDEVQSRIDEQHRTIGRHLVDLKNRTALPRTTELLIGSEEITAALAEIEAREKEKEDLLAEIAAERTAFTSAAKNKEAGS